MVLHCVVFFGLFLVTVVQALKPKDEPHVFVMVEPPSADSGSNRPPPPDLSIPDLEVPAVPEMPSIAPINVPKPPSPLPVPTPPKPKPTPTPQPPAPKPIEQPQETITMEEFLKNHTIREPRQPKPQPTTPREVPKIDTSRLQEQLDQMLRDAPSGAQARELSPTTQEALVRYNNKLRARIDGAWVKPSNLAGVRLYAEVVFNVSASGQISNVRLKSSSGNSAFDQSILSAFAKVSSAGPTPSGQAHVFSMRFRMTD